MPIASVPCDVVPNVSRDRQVSGERFVPETRRKDSCHYLDTVFLAYVYNHTGLIANWGWSATGGGTAANGTCQVHFEDSCSIDHC
jgi:hypothetical protein